MDRIDKLVHAFSHKNITIDAVLVSSHYNRRYFSGFTGSSGYLMITAKRKIILTDFRYVQQARKECHGFEVIDFFEKGLCQTINDIVKCDSLKVIGFENIHMTVEEFDNFADSISGVKWAQLDHMMERIRMIKDQKEIDYIKGAAAISDMAFTHMTSYIKIGMTEKDVALELEYFMKKSGADKLSFDTIVASGVRSSLPHGLATDKVIEQGDLVTLDFGCVYKGYCSDMTRTIVMGTASKEQRDLYELVLKAQINACRLIKAGVVGKVADSYARDIIDQAGYRVNFGHSLGHGIGLEVHELPRFSLLSEDIIAENTVMSVEPGIYIADFGGVRIEDLVVVTQDGVINLCESSKDLIEITI